VTQLKNAGCGVIMLVSLPGVTGKVLGTAAQLGYAPRWIGTSPSWHQALAASPIKDYLVRNFWVSNLGPSMGDTSHAGVRTMLAAQQKYSPGQEPDFYYYAGYYMGFPVKATLAKAVESGTLTRAGIFAASQAFPSSDYDGIYGEYTYGAVEGRNPPRYATIFRVNPSGVIGLEVEKSGVSMPAAKAFTFEAR
jgi:ABC-type branched-subunit amino acid transport system substrate-binding protein